MSASADLLRRAAKALRDQAEPIKPATATEAWCYEYAHHAIRHVERNVDLDLKPCPDHGHEHGMLGRYSGRYVAMMHPPVALALADWLSEEAERIHRIEIAVDPQVVDIARAILREAP